MALDGTDISWDVLRQILREWSGSDADLKEVRPLDGGQINITLALTTIDDRKTVLKISPHRVDRTHADEALQLELLKDTGLPVPQVYAWQIGSLDRPYSYILMEHVDGVDLLRARPTCGQDHLDHIQRELAGVLLRLHDRTCPHYMRVCGEEPERLDTWPAFYRKLFDPVLREVDKNQLLPVKTRKVVAKLHDRLDHYLPNNDGARLLHGDLWCANIMVRRQDDSRWTLSAVLDPDCRYGDPEAELAYLDLFHTVGKPFMEAYQHEKKLPADYHKVRKPIYQLYSLLNTLQLRGGEHIKPVMTHLEKLTHLI